MTGDKGVIVQPVAALGSFKRLSTLFPLNLYKMPGERQSGPIHTCVTNMLPDATRGANLKSTLILSVHYSLNYNNNIKEHIFVLTLTMGEATVSV